MDITVSPSKLGEIAQLENVFAIEERGLKRRLDEAQGQILAGNLSGNVPTGPGYLTFLSNKGFTSSQFGSFVVEVVDDATSITGHPDLPTTRVAFQNNPTNQTGAQGGHGFLNTNIIGGFNNGTGSAVEDANGFNYGLGIAPFARMGSTAIFGATAASASTWENTAFGQGARISSNSWGFTDNVGNPIPRYDTNAQMYDSIVRDAQTVAGLQQLTVVFAAGNDGSGGNTVSTPGTAKNVLTVGAGENVRMTGTDGCGIGNTGADSANDVISFSSRGPVNSAGGDGRIKPEIMAPGTHIEAGVPQSNYNGSSVCNQFFPAGQTLYGWSSGTSHSTPAVAGGAALVYQDFLNKGLSAPSPAMVKAYLLNSATRMTGTGANDTLPSNNEGMGRMDLSRAFDGASRILVDQTQVLGATGATFQVAGSVANTSLPLRVTLVWTDAPGPTTGAAAVNNLDLEVTVGGTTFKGNVFSGGSSVSGGTADPRNNFESVFLPAGTTGSITVTVRATNIAGDGVPGNADTTDQDFALVVYNATQTTAGPTIGVSPASFTFSATAGGANPASQSLSVTNNGGGTLTWSATDDGTWLTIAPTSGTAPSTVTLSVNTAGLAAGTYNATITVSATGATNSPVSVPVTLTVSNPTSELITNGGFEGSSTPWTLTGNAIRSTGSFPHSGTGYLIVANTNSTTGTAFQTIIVPAGSAAALTFWLNVTTSETTTTTQFDRLFVEVRNTSGTLLSTLATFSNLNRGTAGVYTQRGPFSLSSFAGQTVRIQFRATEDVSLPTSFRVDDVSAH
ncbi:MAG TPA: S8 family serine peptidase [Blastocatellia bacterium]|nr:S8 family serine peptidase [Blastocatellia bacterium]